MTHEVKLLRVAARLLEDEGPSQPGRAPEPMSRRADAAIISLEEPVLDVHALPPALSGGTVPPTADGDVSQRWH